MLQAFPTECVGAVSDLWNLTHHGMPVMGYLIISGFFLGLVVLIYATGYGAAILSLTNLDMILVGIGLSIGVYGLCPPLVAYSMLLGGSFLFSVQILRMVYRVRQGTTT